MTTIFVCLCGKNDESQNLENDFKDKNGPLNRQVLFLRFSIKILGFSKDFCFIKRTRNQPIT